MDNQLGIFDLDPEYQALGIVCEYFILISPPDQVKKDVTHLKQKLHDLIALEKLNLFSIPHITLLKHRASEEKDTEVIGKMLKCLAMESAFQVRIQNAGFFKTGNIAHIILNVERSAAIQQLFNRLNQEFNHRDSANHFNPHLTIARGISHQDLETVLPLLHTFDYEACFACNGITVLKRTIQKIRNKMITSKYEWVHEVSLN